MGGALRTTSRLARASTPTHSGSALEDLEPKPFRVTVAEEMNTTTRVDNFRKLVQAKIRRHSDAGEEAGQRRLAHLDLCCAIVGEDEKGDFSPPSWKKFQPARLARF